MIDKCLIFINNDLENFQQLYENIKKLIPYKTEFITYEDCKNDYIINIFKSVKPVDLIIILSYVFYETVKKNFNIFLSSLYGYRFSNIIRICAEYENLFRPAVLNGEEYCLYLSDQHDLALQAGFFYSYVSSIFDKSITNDRLNDYICNSFREVVYSELLAKKNKRLKKLNEELEKKNRIDHLTQLYNKTALSDFLEYESRRSTRHLWRMKNNNINITRKKKSRETILFANKPVGDLREHLGIFSLMLVEIKTLEKINEDYGYLKGDEILIALARILQGEKSLRKSDIIGRLGGGQFFVILPETNSRNALKPALRVEKLFNTKGFEIDGMVVIYVHLSIGISQFEITDQSGEDVLTRARKALDSAREQQDSSVMIYEELDHK